MSNRLASVIISWHFVIALLVLLANDCWLKAAYRGLITGKLSDFVGLAIVALLLYAARPKRCFSVCFALTIGFVFWKSNLSDPLIRWINSFAPIKIGRTVDYADLVALVVVPFCYRTVARQTDATVTSPIVRRLVLPPLLLATALGIMGTSMVGIRQEYMVRRTEGTDELRRDQIAKVIASVTSKYKMSCADCAEPTSSATYCGNGMTLTYTISGANVISFRIDSFANGLFFGASGLEKAERLRASLKRALAENFYGLEYVESLKPDSRSSPRALP